MHTGTPGPKGPGVLAFAAPGQRKSEKSLQPTRSIRVSLRDMSGWLSLRTFSPLLGTLAALACLGSAEAQCTSTESCLVTHGPGGCDSQQCCLTVCASDPTCCSAEWDASCVSAANLLCVGYCGAAASGSCLSVHANPSCDNGDCCSVVCVFDPFCCTTSWDLSCVQVAGFACPGTPGTCGKTTESCFEAHTQGACSDVTCCNAVCTLDPTCCTQSWDLLCVYTAKQTCVSGCQPSPDPVVENELESCKNRQNDPCYLVSGGTPETMTANIQKRGGLGITVAGTPADVDVYAITVPDPDGDGIAKVTLRFSSSPAAWAALVPPTTCAPIAASIVHASSNLCVETDSASICVPAGPYFVVVSGGTYPNFGGEDIICGSGNLYTVKLEVTQACAVCTNNPNSCFAPQNQPGCTTPSCCAAVCGLDPFCCDGAWDVGCVDRAGSICVSAPPSNDTCAGATALSADPVMVNTAGATLDAGIVAECGQGALVRDVWLVYDADVGGTVSVETCGAWFDTIVSVYQGVCSNAGIVACSDNATDCPGPGSSRAPFTAVCGQRYFIRVGPKSGQGGDVIVRLNRGTLPPCGLCVGDLDRSGVVDAQDITILLNGWGTASGDVNGDGTTNAQDIAALLNAWGACQ